MHNIHYEDYPENVKRDRVQEFWNDYVRHDDWQEGASGIEPIEWLKLEPFDTREDAQKYIDDHDYRYRQFAVRYKEAPNVSDKKRDELTERINAARKAYEAANLKVHYNAVASEFVGCKACGSRISRKHLKSNRCPVCGVEMRPQSTLDAIERLRLKWKSLLKDLNERNRYLAKKHPAEVRWLLKVEWHT